MRSWLGWAAVVVVVDQLSKQAALMRLPPYQFLPVAPHLNLTLVYNPGASFGILADAGGWQRWLFVVVTIAICLYLCIWLRRLHRGEWLSASGIALILGGAIGNLIDRLLYGHVVDFIDVYYDAYHWPTFNVADIAITVGAIMLVTIALFDPRKTK